MRQNTDALAGAPVLLDIDKVEDAKDGYLTAAGPSIQSPDPNAPANGLSASHQDPTSQDQRQEVEAVDEPGQDDSDADTPECRNRTDKPVRRRRPAHECYGHIIETPACVRDRMAMVSEWQKGRPLDTAEINEFCAFGVQRRTLDLPYFFVADLVVFLSRRSFEFARYTTKAIGENPVPAFIVPITTSRGPWIDLVAWNPSTERLATWLGRAFALGEESLSPPHLEPIAIFRTPLGWLRSERHGIVIVQPHLAWSRLDAVPVFGEDAEHERYLVRNLSRRFKPKIVPPRWCGD
jgi:hypothetical protein